MIQKSWKSILFGTVVVGILLTTVQSAHAWWYGCYRPVYYGCYSSCYSVCDPCGGWYSGYRAVPVRRAACGPYRGYYAGGWCGSYYSTGCYSSYNYYNEVATCCNSTTATSASSAPGAPTPAKKPVIEAPAAPAMPVEPGEMPAQPNPNEPPAAMPGMVPADPTMPVEPGSTFTPTPETSGVVTVWVPFDAKVTINGIATRSTGSRRQFVSFGLKPGFSYKYEIRAEVVKEGKTMEDTRTVVLTAGQNTAVAFGFTTTPTEELASAK